MIKRLTERDEYNNADIIGIDSTTLYDNLDFNETNTLTVALNKLAALEDIENDLGCNLIILFRALKSNKLFYITDENRIEEYVGTIEIVDTTNIKLPFVAVRDLKDYGKTWALTREELEEIKND